MVPNWGHQMCCRAIYRRMKLRSDASLKAVDLSLPVTEPQVALATYRRIAADVVGVARELRRARTPEEKRDVMAALLWHAESIRRTIVSEQDASLRRAQERPE